MMSRRAEVLHEVLQERDRQDIRWGGADHDDEHARNDEFFGLVRAHAAREPLSPSDARRLLIEVAALAVAGVEAMDRMHVQRSRS
jgi:hypothetical protein